MKRNSNPYERDLRRLGVERTNSAPADYCPRFIAAMDRSETGRLDEAILSGYVRDPVRYAELMVLHARMARPRD